MLPSASRPRTRSRVREEGADASIGIMYADPTHPDRGLAWGSRQPSSQANPPIRMPSIEPYALIIPLPEHEEQITHPPALDDAYPLLVDEPHNHPMVDPLPLPAHPPSPPSQPPPPPLELFLSSPPSAALSIPLPSPPSSPASPMVSNTRVGYDDRPSAFTTNWNPIADLEFTPGGRSFGSIEAFIAPMNRGITQATANKHEVGPSTLAGQTSLAPLFAIPEASSPTDIQSDPPTTTDTQEAVNRPPPPPVRDVTPEPHMEGGDTPLSAYFSAQSQPFTPDVTQSPLSEYNSSVQQMVSESEPRISPPEYDSPRHDLTPRGEPSSPAAIPTLSPTTQEPTSSPSSADHQADPVPSLILEAHPALITGPSAIITENKTLLRPSNFLPILAALTSKVWPATGSEQYGGYDGGNVTTGASRQILAAFRFEPGLVSFKRWSHSLRSALIVLSGSRQIRGDNAAQAQLFARSGDITHIRRIFKYLDQIQARCPSAVKTLLDTTDSATLYPYNYSRAVQHSSLVHAHKQAKESEGQRLQQILCASAILSASSATPQPTPPVPPPPDITHLTAVVATATAASAAAPDDMTLATAAASAARALADALPVPGAVQTAPTNPQAQLQNMIQQLAVPASASLTPLPPETEEFLEVLCELLNPDLNVPASSEFQLIKQCRMGVPDALHPETSPAEGPRAFGDRVIQTFRLLQMDSPAGLASGYQVNLRACYYEGLPAALRETAITESHRYHPSRTSAEECIRGISEVLDAQHQHMCMERMNRGERDTGTKPRQDNKKPPRPPSTARERPASVSQGKPMYCSHHQSDTHNTRDCLALKSMGRWCSVHQTTSHSDAECTAQRTSQEQYRQPRTTPATGTRRVTWDDTQHPAQSAIRAPIKASSGGNQYPPPPSYNQPQRTLRSDTHPKTPGNQPYRAPGAKALVTNARSGGELVITRDSDQEDSHLNLYAALTTAHPRSGSACLSIVHTRLPESFTQVQTPTSPLPPPPLLPLPPPLPLTHTAPLPPPPSSLTLLPVTPTVTQPLSINDTTSQMLADSSSLESSYPVPFIPDQAAIHALVTRVLSPGDMAGVRQYMSETLGKTDLTYLVNPNSRPDLCLMVGYGDKAATQWHRPINALIDSGANVMLLTRRCAEAWGIPFLPYEAPLTTSLDSASSGILGITPCLTFRYGCGPTQVCTNHCALVVEVNDADSIYDLLLSFQDFREHCGQFTATDNAGNGLFQLQSSPLSAPVQLPTICRQHNPMDITINSLDPHPCLEHQTHSTHFIPQVSRSRALVSYYKPPTHPPAGPPMETNNNNVPVWVSPKVQAHRASSWRRRAEEPELQPKTEAVDSPPWGLGKTQGNKPPPPRAFTGHQLSVEQPAQQVTENSKSG